MVAPVVHDAAPGAKGNDPDAPRIPYDAGWSLRWTRAPVSYRLAAVYRPGVVLALTMGTLFLPAFVFASMMTCSRGDFGPVASFFPVAALIVAGGLLALTGSRARRVSFDAERLAWGRMRVPTRSIALFEHEPSRPRPNATTRVLVARTREGESIRFGPIQNDEQAEWLTDRFNEALYVVRSNRLTLTPYRS